MAKRVLIIGGYGNFGGIIARALVQDPNIQVIVGGRSLPKAQKFVATLKPASLMVPPEAIALDIGNDLHTSLQSIKPDIVIHTTGPFQGQGYGVLEACLHLGCHYIDLADARLFVAKVSDYDKIARQAGVLAVSGASSVPCLTAAVLDAYLSRFAILEKVEYGITVSQSAIRGVAAVAAAFSYLGEPFETRIDSAPKTIYGWQNLHAHTYPVLGTRFFSNCDVPDLELFPARYPQLQTIRFSASLELPPLQAGLWLLSWIVRSHALPPLEFLAPHALTIARLFDSFGKKGSGFHMLMYGEGHDGKPQAEALYIVAQQNHGVNIPCAPAIILAKKLASGELTEVGARPCLDLIDLDTYVGALKDYDIKVIRDVPPPALKAKAPVKAKAAPAKKAQAAAAAARKPTPVERTAYSYRDDTGVPSFPDDKPLFIFDGICVLCSRGAAWMMRNKKGSDFYYASMQSPLGQALYRHYGIPVDDTFLLIDKGMPFTKTDGYFRIGEILGPPWAHLKHLKAIPREVRDWLYDFVARNRYKWFGKTKTRCELIPEEYRKNMLG